MTAGLPQDQVLREFFVGFAAVHILHHAIQAPVYGTAMMEELRRHGYEISPGTIYPLLHRLESQGLLVSEERVVEGRGRKYYSATWAGRSAMEALRPKIAELVSEVIEGKGPSDLSHPDDA